MPQGGQRRAPSLGCAVQDSDRNLKVIRPLECVAIRTMVGRKRGEILSRRAQPNAVGQQKDRDKHGPTVSSLAARRGRQATRYVAPPQIEAPICKSHSAAEAYSAIGTTASPFPCIWTVSTRSATLETNVATHNGGIACGSTFSGAGTPNPTVNLTAGAYNFLTTSGAILEAAWGP